MLLESSNLRVFPSQVVLSFRDLPDGSLHAVLLLELEVLLPEGVDAVDHALHELDLGVAEAVLVRDVVGVACGDEGNGFRSRLQSITQYTTDRS